MPERARAASLNKTQIDRLGDRLRQASVSEGDLRSLDDYRRSFADVYATVVQAIKIRLQIEPTGRPAKSTTSIIEKLHRESIRLSQVQDIAGCRIVVPTMAEQEKVVASLRTIFPDASVIDRRATPSYGYRAIHIVVRIDNMLVEIQVRTESQHFWAELSEKLSDVIDPSVKYGGGPAEVREILSTLSTAISMIEEAEAAIEALEPMLASLESTDAATLRLQQELRVNRQRIADARALLLGLANRPIPPTPENSTGQEQ